MTDDALEQQVPLRAAQLVKLGALSMSSERDGDVHRVCLLGELDLATAESVELELLRVEATDARSIVVDLSGLTFMDSTGCRLVLTANARSLKDPGRLSLVRGSAAVQRVLELIGVDGLLPFVD